ncbi:hypothetical protein ACFYWX_16750 [Streptomyces sp. NPDC002888]|uniref:hypothetical protein n=1 Tax=Streptomyces sp. NPDC002888 TaxID=3364668 RepID=UPI0036A7A206
MGPLFRVRGSGRSAGQASYAANFVRASSGLYGDIKALHPFREGNGSAQRAFLGELSKQAGRPINRATPAPDENQEASIKSFLGDNQPLERMLDRLVSQGPG